MIRPRLRSNNGCTQCRARRKKCDETKPICQACSRLRLPCLRKNVDNSVRIPPAADTASIAHASLSSSAHPLSLRVPDFVSVRRSDQPELPDLEGLINDASIRKPDGYDHDTYALQDFIIQGVRKGWYTIPHRPDTECMARLDRSLEACGHGQAARIAFCWLVHMLQTCLRLWRSGNDSAWSGLPHWYLPQRLQTSRTDIVLDPVDFLAWPSLRQRTLNQSSTYLNEIFMLELASDGIRFIWPYSYAEIVTVHQETGQYQFSDEFSMRVSNLRSFALTKDFLDKYPQLRGDAAQVEPSITTYQLSEASITETIFWAKMRETRHKKDEEAKAESTAVGKVEATLRIVDE